MPKAFRRLRHCLRAAASPLEIGAAIDQALSRLARSGKLMRICQGVYMRPVETRFGVRGPRIGKALAPLSALWGETIVPCGGAAANSLGLTAQNPVRMVYLTSGPSKRLHFGAHTVELRHAPRWQLAAPHRKAGKLIRALAWLGPEEVKNGLEEVLPTLTPEELEELSAGAGIDAELDGRARERATHAWLTRVTRNCRTPTVADVLEVVERASVHKAHLLEKDIWVVAALNALFGAPFGQHLIFKGGTSLSKVWRAIRRFSEDVDVTYDIRAFAPDLVAGRRRGSAAANTQSGKALDACDSCPPCRVGSAVKPCRSFRNALAGAGFDGRVRADGDRLYIGYEPLFEETDFVRPEVKLEFGARSTGETECEQDCHMRRGATHAWPDLSRSAYHRYAGGTHLLGESDGRSRVLPSTAGGGVSVCRDTGTI